MTEVTQPGPGWHDDPYGNGQLRWWDGRMWTAHTAVPILGSSGESPTKPPLDRAMARMAKESDAGWGARPVVIPLVTLIALIIASSLVSAFALPRGTTARLIFAAVGTFVLDGALVAAVWWAGRDVAARHGGWGATFGWRKPRWSDLGHAAVGALVVLLLRGVVGVVANGATHGRASKEAQNIHINHISVPGVIVLVLAVVIWAPLVEELVFRGLLLRTFMRRWSFWPSAVLSTEIFAVLHTYEVNTVAGALTLAAGVGVLGLGNCVLARLTDSLAPGIMVHAAFNALAVVVLVAMAS